MKSGYKIMILFGLSVVMTSCFDTKEPNYQYMPNMYEAAGYETYAPVPTDAFKNGKEGQLPAEGSLNRGFEVYDYENSTAGYDLAKANLKSPIEATPENLEKGKALYDIYCAICHGSNGAGDGKLVKQEKFLGVPNYKDREITEGSIFHVETYGLNAMGSHANQLSKTERWLVAGYVMKLRSE